MPNIRIKIKNFEDMVIANKNNINFNKDKVANFTENNFSKEM